MTALYLPARFLGWLDDRLAAFVRWLDRIDDDPLGD